MTDPVVPQELRVTVAHRKDVADRVVELTLQADEGVELWPWTPGAHVDLHLAPDLVRQYSLCGDPADRSTYRVAVLRELEGRGGSAHVHDVVAQGDRLTITAPRNHFELRPSPRYHFVAGGIGITPILAMIGAADARGDDWHLTYLGRSHGSMAYAADLVTAYPGRVTLHVDAEHGFPDLAALLGAHSPDTPVYACGPTGLLEGLEKTVAAWPSPSLHVERFVAQEVDTSGDQPFVVRLLQSGMDVTVPADQSILDAISAAGVPTISSCREGTCGTCETSVVSGTVDHRDAILDDDERAEGTCMMICVSRSTSPVLELDL